MPVLNPTLAGGQPRRYAPGMDALAVAIIYFGTFLAIGSVARRLLDRWMDIGGVHLTEVQDQMGENRRKQPGFLLGAWYRR